MTLTKMGSLASDGYKQVIRAASSKMAFFKYGAEATTRNNMAVFSSKTMSDLMRLYGVYRAEVPEFTNGITSKFVLQKNMFLQYRALNMKDRDNEDKYRHTRTYLFVFEF